MKSSKPPVPAPRNTQEPTTSVSHETNDRPPLPVRPRKDKLTATSGCSDVTKQETTESLSEFGRRKNFTENEINMALERTTLSGQGDQNYFLSQLMSVRSAGTSEGQSLPTLQPPRRINVPDQLKNIILDGSNIAMTHGNGKFFSNRGLQIAVDWFRNRGHRLIKVFVPDHRKEASRENRDIDILLELSAKGVVIFTPSTQTEDGTRVTCYDDRFILKHASETKGIVVSNDRYKDLIGEDPGYRETINRRLLRYTFVDDSFMPAEDPMGRKGATLEQFLRMDNADPQIGRCPYGRKCTYGTKCKYDHSNEDISALKVQNLANRHEQLLDLLKKQDNNNIEKNQQTVASNSHSNRSGYPSHVADYSSSIVEFSNHPANLHSMAPRLLARGGVAEPSQSQVEQYQSQSGHRPQRIVLKQDQPLIYNSQQDNNHNFHPSNAVYGSPITQYPPQLVRKYPNLGSPQQSGHTENYATTRYPNRRDPGRQMGGYHSEPASLEMSCGEDFTVESNYRYTTYFHLKNLFPDPYVREAMRRLPNETENKVICQEIMRIMA